MKKGTGSASLACMHKWSHYSLRRRVFLFHQPSPEGSLKMRKTFVMVAVLGGLLGGRSLALRCPRQFGFSSTSVRTDGPGGEVRGLGRDEEAEEYGG